MLCRRVRRVNDSDVPTKRARGCPSAVGRVPRQEAAGSVFEFPSKNLRYRESSIISLSAVGSDGDHVTDPTQQSCPTRSDGESSKCARMWQPRPTQTQQCSVLTRQKSASTERRERIRSVSREFRRMLSCVKAERNRFRDSRTGIALRVPVVAVQVVRALIRPGPRGLES